MELSAAAKAGGVELTLPRPDSGFERFRVVESPVMEPGLEQWMQDQGVPMKTYRAESLDRPGVTARLDWGGPNGLHAMVTAPGGTYFVDPYWKGDVTRYATYFKRDFGPPPEWRCLVDHEPVKGLVAKAGGSTGGVLRTYRLANAATGEYTTYHGGTVALAQAEIITAINRVNQVYERDFSIRLILVANNTDVVYTDGTTDPYTNGSASALLNENQTNLDSVIGDDNYDIGHVFSTAGGGLASLGVPCQSGSKARGETGLAAPEGDPFYIDYVAHEMGHQYNARHTFNSTLGSCAGNWSAAAAYEPGSASTIMGYAGICGVLGADDLQNNSDDYFHGFSLDEALNYAVAGGSCSTDTAVINPNPPTVSAGSDYTIPQQTPFELTASGGADPDGGTITYCWEEFDLGPQAPLSAGDNGSSPIFRSWDPTTSPVRVFPRLTDLVNNTTSPGEILPTTNRTMSFRVTVRDNDPDGGRVGEDAMQVTSTTSSGPFVVTAPNTGAEVWYWSTTATVTWNVAGTTGAPVSAANVDILLSTDGGLTYPTTLASSTPNDGSQAVNVPSVTTSTARVKVKGSGNIFFDISNADFQIQQDADLAVTKIDSPDPVAAGSNLSYAITATNNGPSTATDVQISDTTPTGTTFVSASPSAGGSCTTPAVGGTGAITCTWAGSTAAAVARTLTLVVAVPASTADGATISNTATTTSVTPDSVSGNNSATALTTVQRQIDLVVAKSDTPDPVIAGSGTGNLTHVVTVTNNGPSDGSGISLGDALTLPAGVVVDSVTPSAGTVGGASPSYTWSGLALTPSASATLTIVMTVDATVGDGATVSDTATVTASNEARINTGDDAATAATTVQRSADLAVTKTLPEFGPQEPYPGLEFTYTLDVTNNGPSDATGVMVTDTLPDSLSYVSDSCGGTYTAATNTWEWSVASLANGASESCDLAVRLDPFFPGGVIDNLATVAGNETDPVGSNDSVSVQVMGSDKVPGIPELSAAGAMLLVLLLAAASLAVLRRHGA